MKRLILTGLFSFGLLLAAGISQEICNNAIDDDGDGLIDLNDTDCECTEFRSKEYIVNGNFEEFHVCPNSLDDFREEYIQDWKNISHSTSDYFNKCSFFGKEGIAVPPTPLPSGNGCAGVIDETDGQAPNFSSYKEYITHCLKEKLVPGQKYELSFYVAGATEGKVDNTGRKTSRTDHFNWALYGEETCSSEFLATFEAPSTQDPDRFKVLVEDEHPIKVDQWEKFSIEFTVDKAISQITFGPSPTLISASRGKQYYFIDEMSIRKVYEITTPVIKIDEISCESAQLSISNLDKENFTDFQWYKDGVAIQGATNNSLSINEEFVGSIAVSASVNGSCVVSADKIIEIKDFEVIAQYTPIPCNERYTRVRFVSQPKGLFTMEEQFFNNTDSVFLSDLEEGVHTFTFNDTKNCRKEVSFHIEKALGKRVIEKKICPGESVEFFGEEITKSGTYQKKKEGLECDSLIVLELEVRDGVVEVDIEEFICPGGTVTINNEVFSTTGSFERMISSSSSCDSLLRIEIKEKEAIETNIERTVCDEKSFRFGNRDLTDAGMYREKFQSQSGCDSIVHLDLTFGSTQRVEEARIICAGDSIAIFDTLEYESGIYEKIFQSISGCDSVVVVTLEVLPEIRDTNVVTLCSGDSIEIANQMIDKAGVYEFNHTALSGCDSVVVIEVVIEEFKDEVQLDINCDDQTVEAFLKLDNSYVVKWDNDSSGLSTKYKTEGGFREVTIKSPLGCETKRRFTLPVLKEPLVILNDTVVEEGQELHYIIDVNPTDWNTSWVSIHDIDCVDCVDVTIIPRQSGNVKVIYAHKETGCQYETEFFIRVEEKEFVKENIYLPNAFSPNSDGINDIWKPFTNTEYKLQEGVIYNRWGSRVYEFGSKKEFEWDGVFRGKSLDAGTYIYSITVLNNRGQRFTYKGSVELL